MAQFCQHTISSSDISESCLQAMNVRYDLSSAFWVMGFGCIFKNLHTAASDVNLGAIGCECLSTHQTNAGATACNQADLKSHLAEN